MSDKEHHQTTEGNLSVPSPDVLNEMARLNEQYIWISDGNRDSYRYLSENFDDLLGTDRELLLQNPDRWVKMIDQDPPEYEELLRGKGSYKHQFQFTNLKAESSLLEEEIRLIDDPDADRKRLLGVITDVTSQEKKMDQLKRSTKYQTLGTMASGIMHEINNPNGSLQGNLDFSQRVVSRLREQLAENVDSDALDLFEEMSSALESSLEQSERIEALVNEVELFSKEAQFSQNPDLLTESTPLHRVEQLLQEQVNKLDQKFEVFSEPNLSVETNIESSSDDQRSIPLSERRLEIIYQHLVQNALDATRDTENTSINIKLRINEQQLIVHVVDNGRGFETKSARLLDPFHTTKSAIDRLGLGLSIIESIMQRIGGSLKLKSQDQMGTTVLVRIPLRDR